MSQAFDELEDAYGFPDEFFDRSKEENLYLTANVTIGEELTNFFRSNGGQFLFGKAKEQLRSARNNLETVAVTDQEEIVRLQRECHVARSFLTWLAEGIMVGEQALKTLRGDDETGEP